MRHLAHALLLAGPYHGSLQVLKAPVPCPLRNPAGQKTPNKLEPPVRRSQGCGIACTNVKLDAAHTAVHTAILILSAAGRVSRQ